MRLALREIQTRRWDAADLRQAVAYCRRPAYICDIRVAGRVD